MISLPSPMPPKKANRQMISLRLSAEGRALLRQLSEEFAITQAAVIEIALREMSKRSNKTF